MIAQCDRLKVPMTVAPQDARTCADAKPRPKRRVTVSDGSEPGFQAGGPVGARAVPTELRWKPPLRSRPNAVVACNEGAGWSTAGRSSGGLTGGRPRVVSRNDSRDNMPSVNGWSGRSSAAGCLPSASRWATSASGTAAGTAAGSTGKEGRANGAIARRAATHAANQPCSLSRRCARALTGTSFFSRARQTLPGRGARRQRCRMLPGKEAVKSASTGWSMSPRLRLGQTRRVRARLDQPAARQIASDDPRGRLRLDHI
jgi:hypothetical protein